MGAAAWSLELAETEVGPHVALSKQQCASTQVLRKYVGNIKSFLGLPGVKYPLESWLSGLFPWILDL